jgi:protein-S-isoprenylcysteine O-methyltransferase Ste14
MRSDRRVLLAFFGLTFVLSWAIWVPVMTSSFGWPGLTFPAAGLVGALMPGVAALLVLGFTAGWGGIRNLLKQVLVWRVVEEHALASELGDQYRDYMRRSKRLVPYLI